MNYEQFRKGYREAIEHMIKWTDAKEKDVEYHEIRYYAYLSALLIKETWEVSDYVDAIITGDFPHLTSMEDLDTYLRETFERDNNPYVLLMNIIEEMKNYFE